MEFMDGVSEASLRRCFHLYSRESGKRMFQAELKNCARSLWQGKKGEVRAERRQSEGREVIREAGT